jgi:hypothetical protein
MVNEHDGTKSADSLSRGAYGIISMGVPTESQKGIKVSTNNAL